MICPQSSENFQQEFPARADAPARAAVGPDASNAHAPPSLRATVRGDTLAAHTFACGRCHKASQQLGSCWTRYRGMRRHVCGSCKTALQQNAKPPEAAC